MSGLRERNKARRREAILDAALELLRSHPLEAVTTEQIAERAEVSLATVYNLVGTREQLHQGLVDRVLEGLVRSLADGAAGRRDPIEAARLIVDQSAAAFVADGAAFRQIVRVTGRRRDRQARMALDPSRLQVVAMRDAQRAGVLRAELDPVALGRQIYVAYVGALMLWSGGTLSDEGFALAARHGLIAVVAAAASPAHQPAFARELAALGARLVESGWHGRAG